MTDIHNVECSGRDSSVIDELKSKIGLKFNTFHDRRTKFVFPEISQTAIYYIDSGELGYKKVWASFPWILTEEHKKK